MDEMMTPDEVASYLHLCKKTVYSLAKQGSIPYTKVGTNMRFSRSEIDKVLKTYSNNPKQFLVIDDAPPITKMIKQVLTSRGHYVLTAESGKEGVAFVHDCKFDKIFLDLRMPDMDGAETLRQIRQISPDVPVIVITGYPDPVGYLTVEEAMREIRKAMTGELSAVSNQVRAISGQHPATRT